MKDFHCTPCYRFAIAAALLALCGSASAATFSFDADPFAGSTALTTPGRQIVGGESFISFLPASDVFAFNPAAFGIGSISFANNVVSSLPTNGVNAIVLRTFDDDATAATAFAAANAANLIAAQITVSTPGFFVYFNSGLDLPRLVYSTDLSDNTADLKILARMTNLSGQTGRDALATFGPANFQISSVPESGSVLTIVIAAAALVFGRRVIGRKER